MPPEYGAFDSYVHRPNFPAFAPAAAAHCV